MKRLILILLVLPSLSFAQETDSPPDRKVIYPKATHLDFDVAEVEAALNRPSIILSMEIRGLVFPSMPALRKDFNPEMEASVHDVK